LAAAVLGLAAVASCGGADSAPPAVELSSSHDASGPLGALEQGGGQASLILAVHDLLPHEIMSDEGWAQISVPVEEPEVCEDDQVIAEAAAQFIRTDDRSMVSVVVGVFVDEVAATAGLARVVDDSTGCYAASSAQASDSFRDGGLGELEFDEDGESTVEPWIDADGAVARSYSAQYEAGTISGSDHYYQRDSLVVVVGTFSVGGFPEEEQRRVVNDIHHYQESVDLHLSADPDLDTGVDRLRAAVDQAGPGELFQATVAATVEPPVAGQCSPAIDERARLMGPGWASALGLSGVTQVGWTFPDPAQAEAFVDALASEQDPSCVLDGLRPINAELDTSADFATGMVTVGDRRVARAEVTVVGDSSIDPDLSLIATRTQVGTDVVGWVFEGITGDEPDLLALTVAAAGRLGADQ
jgi:hypothetical protein